MDVTFGGEPTQVLPIEETSQIGHARRMAQLAAHSAGLDEADAGRVAIVATELSTNILKHAGRGDIHLAVVQGNGTRGVEIVAIDRGPGFNLADCLPDGFSTGGTRGEGLGAVKRQSQVMDMYADHRGSVVMARLFPRGAVDADIRFGASHHCLHDEPVSGDGWAIALRDRKIAALVIDGLGHGEAAHKAAVIGVAAWTNAALDDPVTLIAVLDRAMTSTRGGAVGMARFDAAADTLRYAGIGNIAGSLQSIDASRGLASHPGIVGVQSRRAQSFDFPQAGGKLLVMHSDGLQSRWNLRDYPGLALRHPAVIAALLHRDFTRGRDDVTVLAIRLEDRP